MVGKSQGRIQEFPDGGVQNFLGGCKFFEERFDSERLYERQREGTAFLNLSFTSMCPLPLYWNRMPKFFKKEK